MSMWRTVTSPREILENARTYFQTKGWARNWKVGETACINGGLILSMAREEQQRYMEGSLLHTTSNNGGDVRMEPETALAYRKAVYRLYQLLPPQHKVGVTANSRGDDQQYSGMAHAMRVSALIKYNDSRGSYNDIDDLIVGAIKEEIKEEEKVD